MARMGSVEIPIDLDTKGFEVQIQQAEEEVQQLAKALETTKNMKPFKGQDEDLKGINLKLEKAKNKLVSLRAQQEKIDYGSTNIQLKQHDKSLSNIIKKVGKWALAVFGLRSIYQFVRQSASTISQYDKKIGADIQYIRYALAYTLKPVIEWLVNAVYTILEYIGAIIKRLTGYNIFQNSGVKNYEKSMKSAEKSSKKTKENLSASFDEFEALSKSNGASGGGSDYVAPNRDLARGLEEIELPKWLEKLIDFIKENKDAILNIAKIILEVLAFSKVISWVAPLGNFFGMFTNGSLLKGIGGVGSALKGIFSGLLISIPIIYATVKNTLEGNKKQRKEINKLTERGVELTKEDVKNIKDIDEVEKNIAYKRQYANELTSKAYSLGAKITGTSGALLNNVKSLVQEEDMYIQKQIEEYRNGKLSKEEQAKLKQILIDQKEHLWDIEDNLEAQGQDVSYINELVKQYNDVLGEIDPKTKQINENFKNQKDILFGLNRIGLEDKTLKVKILTDTKNAGKSLSELAQNFAKVITGPLRSMGMSALADNIMAKAKNLKLASGGIVNMPGKGVPIGAVAGEAGAEAVIPLNDETMERLGSSIARHMSINLTNVNQMNGRTISRELQKIMNEDSFTYNG